MEVNNLRTNRRAQIGNITIPLLKGEQGEQGYSISRIARTDGDGTPGTTDTYTIYINTTPETAIGTFQVTNGTGADMFKEVYDINDDGIVDKATADKEGNDIVQTYATKSALNEMATSFGNEIASNTLRIGNLESAGYITRSVSDLANYYLKSETYTKQEVIALCDEIPKFSIEVVSVLPTQDISETTIYLLRDDEETQDVYQEYIYVNNTWERIGGQRIDLSNYYQKSETYSKEDLNGKLVNVGAEEPENGERVWFKKSKNLFDSNLIQGGRYFFNGNYFSANNYVSNETPIPVIEGNTYTLSADNYNANSEAGFVFMNNGTFISSSKQISQTFSVPSGVNQVYCNFYNNSNITPSSFTNIQLEQGSTATTYEPYIKPSINVDEEEWYSKPKVLFEGALLSGNTLSLDVRGYSKLEVTVQLAKIQGVVFIDLTAKNNGHTINNITYNYSASAVYGAIDDPKFINKCVVAVNNSLNTILAYNFGYADLSASDWSYTVRNNANGWGIKKIVGYK